MDARECGSLFYIAVVLLFGVVFGVLAGWRFGSECFAGYIVEKGLSFDNLFVFVIIMSTFAVQSSISSGGADLALGRRARDDGALPAARLGGVRSASRRPQTSMPAERL